MISCRYRPMMNAFEVCTRSRLMTDPAKSLRIFEQLDKDFRSPYITFDVARARSTSLKVDSKVPQMRLGVIKFRKGASTFLRNTFVGAETSEQYHEDLVDLINMASQRLTGPFESDYH